MQFISKLSAPPKFQEFEKYPYLGSFCMDNDNFLHGFTRYGALDFEKLLVDKLVHIEKDEDGEVIPLTPFKPDGDKTNHGVSQYGQHNEKNKLHGIGRKIKVQPHGNMIQIMEGQFKDNVLDGFARCITITWGGGMSHTVGFHKDGRNHGYGRV